MKSLRLSFGTTESFFGKELAKGVEAITVDTLRDLMIAIRASLGFHNDKMLLPS